MNMKRPLDYDEPRWKRAKSMGFGRMRLQWEELLNIGSQLVADSYASVLLKQRFRAPLQSEFHDIDLNVFDILYKRALEVTLCEDWVPYRRYNIVSCAMALNRMYLKARKYLDSTVHSEWNTARDCPFNHALLLDNANKLYVSADFVVGVIASLKGLPVNGHELEAYGHFLAEHIRVLVGLLGALECLLDAWIPCIETHILPKTSGPVQELWTNRLKRCKTCSMNITFDTSFDRAIACNEETLMHFCADEPRVEDVGEQTEASN